LSTLQNPTLSSVIMHLEQGLDLVGDAHLGFITVVAIELNAWLIALRSQIPAISDTLTITSDADGLSSFAALLTLPDVSGLLYTDSAHIRRLITASIAFLRSVAAYTDADPVC